MEKVTTDDKQAIRNTGGNLSSIAQRLGVEREEVAARMETDDAFRAAVESERERMIDTLESRLLAAAMKGDLKAAARLLRIVGRPAPRQEERGYLVIFRELAQKRIADRKRGNREKSRADL